MKNQDPDWSSFETYKGAVVKSKMPKWLSLTFHYLMIFIILSIVFAIGGFVGFIVVYDSSIRNIEFIMTETPMQAWGRFIIGGILAVTAVIYLRYQRLR